MLRAARKAAPIYADWSGFILITHKHGDSKGIQSLWQGFGDSVPITNPSETRHKDVSAARMLFRMREDAPLRRGLPSNSHLPEPVCRGVSMPAGIDRGSAP